MIIRVLILLIFVASLLAQKNKEKILEISDGSNEEVFSGKLFFENGDSLIGKLVKYNKNNLVWKHPESNNNLTFKTEKVKEIFFFFLSRSFFD